MPFTTSDSNKIEIEIFNHLVQLFLQKIELFEIKILKNEQLRNSQ